MSISETTMWRVGRKAGSIQCSVCTVEAVLNRKKGERRKALVLRLWAWLEKHMKTHACASCGHTRGRHLQSCPNSPWK